MSYLLRGADGQGLGAAPVYEQCNVQDAACFVRNNQKQEAYNLAQLSETRQKQLAFCLSDPGYSAQQCHAQFDPGGALDSTANAGQPVVTYAAAPVKAPVSNGYWNPPAEPKTQPVKTPVDVVDSAGSQVFLPAKGTGTAKSPCPEGQYSVWGVCVDLPANPPVPIVPGNLSPATGATVAKYAIVECGWGQKQVWPDDPNSGPNTCAFDLQTAIQQAWEAPGVWASMVLPASVASNPNTASVIAWAAILGVGYFALKRGKRGR